MLLPFKVIVPTTVLFSTPTIFQLFAKLTVSNFKFDNTPFSISFIAESLPLKLPETGVDPINVSVTSSCHNVFNFSKSLISSAV